MTEKVLVWVVDDDEAIRFVLERALSRAGYATKTFGSVSDIVLALDDSQPAVIITDIRLPDADGLSVLVTKNNLSDNIAYNPKCPPPNQRTCRKVFIVYQSFSC